MGPQRREASTANADDEARCIASALVQRVRDGSMLPDDAYLWAVVICRQLRPVAMKDKTCD